MTRPQPTREGSNTGYNRMLARGVEAFPYYVGVVSLDRVARRDDRVCVLNILGSESRKVTPTSHAYSGGNVVCGTMPGRSGTVLPTPAGDIPVFNNVLEALEAGLDFNVAVVYVPPAGVKDSVIEAARVNPGLDKVFIVTEKVPVRDARIIRQYCQWAGVDVFGANCLGAADAHQRVRIGGALGGSRPEESLVPGSVAVFSNSGNFTTTIAVYLTTAGWGTTTLISSGKDVYIHFAAAEFAHALKHDDRSRAAVLYVEPGGYYERDVTFDKPVVACVVGHWKERLTRPCGHAGAIIGTGDSAAHKEAWLMETLGVGGVFTPDRPVCSARGAVVTNISHIPVALSAVMRERGEEPDFEPRGSLSLKPWFHNRQGLDVPESLRLEVVEAVSPYDQEIARLNEQVGAVFPRLSMKDASGASRMNPETQVTDVHGTSVLEAGRRPFEDNLVWALTKLELDANDRALANVLLHLRVNLHGRPALAAAEAARQSGNSPNTVLAAAAAVIGPATVARERSVVEALVSLFGRSGLAHPDDVEFELGPALEKAGRGALLDTLTSAEPSPEAERIAEAVRARPARSVFLVFLERLAAAADRYVAGPAAAGAIACHLAWRSLVRKKLTLGSVVALPWHLRLFSTLVGAAVPARCHEGGRLCGVTLDELLARWSFTQTAGLALLGRVPDDDQIERLSLLLGLLISNGPGTISAQGAKGAVSADGPTRPERVQINKAVVGFLTHTGFAHGGNGYEAIEFLLDRFGDSGLDDPGSPDHGLDLCAMAVEYAASYKAYKASAKAAGELSYKRIPCVNHPVFKGKEVNHDPREAFVRNLLAERGEHNAFLDFYHELVVALFEAGVSRNVYCVNIDAVIATLLLEMLWRPWRAGELADGALETAAFTAFLLGRTIGVAAEIDDHTSRGRDMDTRVPASQCRAVG